MDKINLLHGARQEDLLPDYSIKMTGAGQDGSDMKRFPIHYYWSLEFMGTGMTSVKLLKNGQQFHTSGKI